MLQLSSRLSLVRKMFILLPLVLAPLTGCATFSNVRSAQVNTGTSLSIQWMATGDLGERATYLWHSTVDEGPPCDPCSHGVGNFDLSVRYGLRPRGSERAYEVGAGVSGLVQAYGEGFVGWNQDEAVTYGVGARFAIAEAEGRDYRVDGRFDWRFKARSPGTSQPAELRLLFNPGVFYHTETQRVAHADGGVRSEHSWFLAAVPGIGFELTDGYFSFTTAVAWVIGTGHRADRIAESLNLQDVRASFPTLSLALTVHRRRGGANRSPRVRASPFRARGRKWVRRESFSAHGGTLTVT